MREARVKPRAIGPVVTHERLRQLLSYDPEAGTFTWLVNIGTARVGRAAGLCRGDGYLVIRIYNRLYYGHRLAWLYMVGSWPEAEVDHVDLNRSNNRWSNLRAATKGQNACNAGLRSDSSTGLKGVTPCGRRFRAQISDGSGRSRHIGCYPTAEAAHAAYCKAAREAFGNFARAS